MSENILSQELVELWKKGETLYSALHEFTDIELFKEYRDYQSKFDNKNKLTRENIKSGAAFGISQTLSDFSENLQISGQIDIAFDKLKWDLLENILSEKLIGLGYEVPVKITNTPTTIPLNLWPRDIKNVDWKNSSISKHGINFVDIRLIKKTALKKKKETNKKIPIPKTKVENKKAGRPNSGDELNAAYDLLKKENRLDFSNSLKAHEELIRDTVKALRQSNDASGTNYKTICKYLGERFRKDKQSIN